MPPMARLLPTGLCLLNDRRLLNDRPDSPGRRHAAPVPEQPDASYLAALDDIEKVRYADINDVTDADINVYAGVGPKV